MTAARSRSIRKPLEVSPVQTATRRQRSSANARNTQSRTVVRPPPQKAVGPQFRIFPRRVVSLRLFALMTVLLGFGLLFGAVAIQSQRISGQREIDLLSANIRDAQDLHHSLRAQVAERESPERITAEAEKLNMIEPGPVVPLTPGALVPSTAEIVPATARDSAQSAIR